MSALVTMAIARYLAFVDKRHIVAYFLVFQEIGDPLRVTNHPFNECHLRGHAPQSESLYATTCKFESPFRSTPFR